MVCQIMAAALCAPSLEQETVDHLLLVVSSPEDAASNFQKLEGTDLQTLMRSGQRQDELLGWWLRCQKLGAKARRKGYDTLVMLIARGDG